MELLQEALTDAGLNESAGIVSVEGVSQAGRPLEDCESLVESDFSNSLLFTLVSRDPVATDEMLQDAKRFFLESYFQLTLLRLDVCDPRFPDIVSVDVHIYDPLANVNDLPILSRDPPRLEETRRNLQDDNITPTSAPSPFNDTTAPSGQPTVELSFFFEALVTVEGTCVDCEADFSLFNFVTDSARRRRSLQLLDELLNPRCLCPIEAELRSPTLEEFIETFNRVSAQEDGDVRISQVTEEPVVELCLATCSEASLAEAPFTTNITAGLVGDTAMMDLSSGQGKQDLEEKFRSAYNSLETCDPLDRSVIKAEIVKVENTTRDETTETFVLVTFDTSFACRGCGETLFADARSL